METNPLELATVGENIPAGRSDSAFAISRTFGKEGCIIEPGKYIGRVMAVLTSGGDAPGMNGAVRAIVRMGLYVGCKVYVIFEGYQGMVDGGDCIKEADWNSVSDIIHRGGTIIGSARSMEFMQRSGRLKAAKNLIDKNISGFVCIGGDGSLTGANLFRTEWPSLIKELLKVGEITQSQADLCPLIQIVGLVGTIDNDFCGTDMTIGTDTALHRITEAIDCVCSTAQSHQRAFVVEVMGRHCGYLSLAASLAVDADFCFIPEWPPPVTWQEILCKKLKQMRDDGTRINIVVVAEGATDQEGNPITSEKVKDTIKKELKYDTRVTVLGHVQRGGNPSAFDRILGCRMGIEATIALMEMNEFSEPCVVSIDGNQMVRLPLMKCVEKTKMVKARTEAKQFEKALELRGRGFKRNLDIYRKLMKIRSPADKNALPFNIAIMNVGSPSSGMNATVRSCVRTCILQGCVPYVIHNSNEGLAQGQLTRMDWNDVSQWTSQSSSFLGTQKSIPGPNLPLIVDVLEKFNINALILIGGFEAYHSCLIYAQNREKYGRLRMPMCVIPCTISNNVPGTCFSIGADTALNEICRMVDKIKQSASGSKRRVFVVETMGGYCGYLATLSGLASAADAAYIHEEIFGVSDLLEDVKTIAQKMRTGSQRYVVIRNEKASRNYTSEFIRQLFSEESKGAFTTRVNVLGHTQQGGSPSPFDRIVGSRMGARAVEHLVNLIKEIASSSSDEYAIENPNTAVLLGIVGRHECLTPVEELAEHTDFPCRRPREQWWIGLRPILKLLAGSHD